MSKKYKLKTGKAGQKVVGAYRRIEEGVVRGYKRIEKKFVDAYLEAVHEEEQ